MRYLIFIFFFVSSQGFGQTLDSRVLSFEEYLGWVKQFHPMAKQAQLRMEEGTAQLLASRGAFDPKIEVDYGRKKFKGTEYYDKLNAVFKIPTWYGIELKGKLDRNSGEFLNPEGIVPVDGLYSAGISFSLADGLWIDDRMAQLKQAKLFQKQTAAERDLLINQLIHDASVAYFDWWTAHQEVQVYDQYYQNSVIRLDAIKRSIEVGDKPAIDSTEASVIAQNRMLGLQEAQLKRIKSGLYLSNFLWTNNEIPIELSDEAIPQEINPEIVESLLLSNRMNMENDSLQNHPKMLALQSKLDQLVIDKRLKVNKLLPKVDLEYNFYSETPDQINSFNTANYFAGVNVSVPLFLRKERGELNLSKYKVQQAEWDLIGSQLNLLNKIKASQEEITSYGNQLELMESLVTNYEKLVAAEERKFDLGESSLFLVNTRENSLIDSKLKQLKLTATLFDAQANMFQVMALPLE